MDNYLNKFTVYLKKEKNMSNNSILAYSRDIRGFIAFLKEKGVERFEDVSNTEIVSFLLKLKNEGKSAATVNRKLASLRAFFNYMIVLHRIDHDPTANIKSPRIERKNIEFLTIDEVERLLAQPDESIKGIRDKALLELLYASGMRVSEIAGANLTDLNLRIGFIVSGGEHGKARIVPLGKPARVALEKYLYDTRSKLIRNKNDTEALFLNYNGERLTRQGIWKLLKEYGKKAKLEHKLTPQILRNSFAAHMIQNGADLKSVQELLGHEDITATQIYLSVNKNRIKDVYDRTHPRA
ncbi:MAG: tyrosine recombinase [Clostridiales bacterium]|nr:tyrosine recombinase [Clostridiales bacterium]